MARITVEDCLDKVNNRFTLIHMAAKRVRLLRKGSEPTISSKNKDIVVSLREIAAGKVIKSAKVELRTIEAGEQPELLPETTAEETQKMEDPEKIEAMEDKEAIENPEEMEKEELEEGGPTE
jgi:DNA-directed RNA polymerase subunit omega